MSNKLYLDCYSGISGDMFVAALLDLGASEEILAQALESLPVQGFKIKVSRVVKSGLDACDFDVILDYEHENHDHDMDYLYGSEYQHEHLHQHHEHRGLAEINKIINESAIANEAKKIAAKIFDILAAAEAKAHGTSKELVYFHEVGAVDSIVDIISAAVCLDNLNIKEVVVPVIYEGTGMINCQHGTLPIPVPAVANIVMEHKLNLSITEAKGELVTPTGAAIAAAIKTDDKLPKSFKIKKIGLGAGKRNYERPSLLRAMVIEENDKQQHIYKLESNIDDCSGEALGYVMEKLLEAGAKDVHYMPVFMKKNRPAYQLNVLCEEKDIDKLQDIIFKETTTIGIRRQKMDRTILKREIQKINTSLGEAEVKVVYLNSEVRAYPEYSSVIKLSEEYNKSYREVYDLIVREYNERGI